MNLKIINALEFQAMERSALLAATGATVEQLDQFIVEGVVIDTGNVSQYRDLQAGEVDEPVYILNQNFEVTDDN